METRHLLPADAYWSDEWFDREQRLLFSHTWHLVAAEDELTEPGSYVSYTAGLDPLVVVRDLDGQLRAFHNLCRHRGMPLVQGCGSSRSGLVCPYHFWSFGLDGALRNVPQPAQFPDLDDAEWGLLPASVGTWGGLVFVHPDPEAETLLDWLGEMPGAIGSYRPELLVEVASYQFDARCNWKLFVENHVDVYHLWYLHARTLGDYDHDRFEWSQVGPHWTSYEPQKEGVERRRPHVGSRPIDGLDTRDRIGIGAHMIFPNTLFATESEFFMSYVPVPIAPDLCLLDVRIRAEDGADAEMLVAAAKDFMLEDIA